MRFWLALWLIRIALRLHPTASMEFFYQFIVRSQSLQRALEKELARQLA